MKFGNWKVAETAAEWAGQGLQRFAIKKQFLTETVNVRDAQGDLFKWIVSAMEED